MNEVSKIKNLAVDPVKLQYEHYVNKQKILEHPQILNRNMVVDVVFNKNKKIKVAGNPIYPLNAGTASCDRINFSANVSNSINVMPGLTFPESISNVSPTI